MVFFVWKKSTCLCFFFVFTLVFNVKATVSDDVYEKAESHWAFKPLVEASAYLRQEGKGLLIGS